MYPILPAGSIVAIDRSQYRPAGCSRGGWSRPVPSPAEPMIRWLEISGRHLILRPNQPSSEHPLIPSRSTGIRDDLIIGQVVWSWSRFSQG